MLAISITLVVILLGCSVSCDDQAEFRASSPWRYECIAGLCKKTLVTSAADERNALSLGICQLFCGQAGALWPIPTGHLSLGNFVAHVDPDKLNLIVRGVSLKSRLGALLEENVRLLRDNVNKLARSNGRVPREGGIAIEIYVTGIKNVSSGSETASPRITLETNENYTLKIHQPEDRVINATITAETYFGARHAIETLSQLIVYDELRNEVKVVRDAHIEDGPVYPYRGILLDTSRNFIDKASIMRTIEAMSMSKMNTFHWHITDSHSFPYVSRTWPKLSKYGAYTPDKIYTESDIREIMNFALVRGVRIVPEFDAPAHVGEGWQWLGDNATVCFRAEPWQNYCVEPPCGQLNPSSERVYEILEGIYTDMIRDFEPDIFHMGGDEVNIQCWRSSKQLTDWMTNNKTWDLSDSSFHKLWHLFQERAYEKLVTANGGNTISGGVVLWTSGLTDRENIHLLDPKKYIIQIWTTGTDPTIARLVDNNFRMIFSNYDALYLDCGFGAWVGEGNNWCSPYKGWQKIYDNSPLAIMKKQGFSSAKSISLILGGEATLWTEQVDGTSLDSRLWPRSAALAERLWAEPQSSWIHAEQRILRHRERLVQRGILADSLEPEWCLQNQGHCYL